MSNKIFFFKFSNVTEKVLEYIDTVYQENSPEYIYFITLYNIFREFLEDISEDVLPNERTGFKNSLIWNKLYNFKKDAAATAADKMMKVLEAEAAANTRTASASW